MEQGHTGPGTHKHRLRVQYRLGHIRTWRHTGTPRVRVRVQYRDTSEQGDTQAQGHIGLGLGFSTGTHWNRNT